MKNFYFFGDSICFGQYISIEKTWVAKVAQSINAKHKNKYVFMNPSVPGNTTRMALERLQHDVLERKPDIVYIQFGMNDCNIWETGKGIERVILSSFESNLDEIIGNCYANGVSKIILATNHPSNKNPEYDKRNIVYNQCIRDVAYS